MKVSAIGRATVLGPVLDARLVFPEIRRLMPRIVDAVVIALEALLAYAWIMQLASAGYLIAAHFAVVLFYFRASQSIAGSLSGAIAFRSAMLFLVGPLVCVGLVTTLVAGRRKDQAKTDRAPADTRAAATLSSADLSGAHADAVYAQIVARRRPSRDPCNRQSLQQAIESGDLDAQQFAIAMISQRYEPEMFAALVSALQSPTPAVRVQAAAVFAKLRERMSGEAKEILQTQSDLRADAPGAVETRNSALAARCRRLADSGFVDAETGAELQKLAEALVAGGPNPGTGPTEPHAVHAHGGTSQFSRRASSTAVT